jgi:hypothetical protein
MRAAHECSIRTTSDVGEQRHRARRDLGATTHPCSNGTTLCVREHQQRIAAAATAEASVLAAMLTIGLSVGAGVVIVAVAIVNQIGRYFLERDRHRTLLLLAALTIDHDKTVSLGRTKLSASHPHGTEEPATAAPPAPCQCARGRSSLPAV